MSLLLVPITIWAYSMAGPEHVWTSPVSLDRFPEHSVRGSCGSKTSKCSIMELPAKTPGNNYGNNGSGIHR